MLFMPTNLFIMWNGLKSEDWLRTNTYNHCHTIICTTIPIIICRMQCTHTNTNNQKIKNAKQNGIKQKLIFFCVVHANKTQLTQPIQYICRTARNRSSSRSSILVVWYFPWKLSKPVCVAQSVRFKMSYNVLLSKSSMLCEALIPHASYIFRFAFRIASLCLNREHVCSVYAYAMFTHVYILPSKTRTNLLFAIVFVLILHCYTQ